MKREPPLVKMLPRRPGTKEARYAHLLSGDVDIGQLETAAEETANSGTADRLARLEEQVAALQKETADLKQEFANFRKQFE